VLQTNEIYGVTEGEFKHYIPNDARRGQWKRAGVIGDKTATDIPSESKAHPQVHEYDRSLKNSYQIYLSNIVQLNV
jgi:hypothetical protein